MNERDERFMRMALRLALRGAGRTSPNPLVGAVLVRQGKILATGCHRRVGGDHAEIAVLKRAGAEARGSTLYINLEPCAHHGRTPPCTHSLIRSRIRRVVAGMVDPNPLVAGKGIRKLQRAGIQVDVGLLRADCAKLNEAFIKYITRRTPFVTLKLAASLDGKIATFAGDSRWITGNLARRHVHRLRDSVDAVVVGSGTVLADDPHLTCRLPGGRNPFRVVLDRRLRIPLTARILRGPDPDKSIIVTGLRAPRKKATAIESMGAQVWRLRLSRGVIPLAPVLQRLGRMGLLSVMIEGGGDTAGRALREKAVDKVLFFYAPKILGGDGRNMIGALEIVKVVRCKQVRDVAIKRFGPDFLVSGYL
jgi:diaminohydroxyphosphoribosylaminopyrimidine deaminase / 5-amino-6-(5-phosphoribosylamino)uracil reductase